MKKLMISLIAVIGFAAFLSTSVTAQEWTKQQKEVWADVEMYWEKWAEGDIEATAAGIHDQYLGWSNERPVPVDKAKVMKWYSMMGEYMKVEMYDLSPVRIAVMDDVAVVHYYFDFYLVYGKEGEKEDEHVKGKNTEFYMKDGDKWVLLGDHTTVMRDDDEDDDD